MFKRITLVSLALAIALFTSEAIESGKASAAKPSAVLQHCSNSFYGNVQPCSGGAWIPGVLDENTSDYAEGDSVPYRVILSNFTAGSTGHTITLEWETTKGGAHGIDYLTSFDRTLTLASGNEPCDVAPAPGGCGTFTTFPIPVDPEVDAANVNQADGVFTLFGGTITAVSAYTYSGAASKRSTRITITFTANNSKMVLAWGGHLARNSDWGDNGGSASDVRPNIQTRIYGASWGSGSKTLSITSVEPEPEFGRIVIIAQAAPESGQVFGFTATGLGSFVLVDDGNDNDLSPNNRTFNGVAGQYTFTQTANGFYDLTNLSCSIVGTGGSTIAPNIPIATVNINVVAGDVVTCTFGNSMVVP